MIIVRDFFCAACGITTEAFVEKDVTIHPCDICSKNAVKVLSAPRVGLYNDPEKASAALKERSHKHSVQEARKNPERLAETVGGKPRAQNKWNVR